VNVGQIKAEEGMATALKEKRDTMPVQSVVAKPDQFDAVYDGGMKDFLNSGGQAIIDERKTTYEEFFKK
jgi:putative aldouronate transport system substrate-binding protein